MIGEVGADRVLGEYQYTAADEAALVAFGERLARYLVGGAVIYLRGDLGMGKTTFCRGVLTGLGHRGNVKSPTYTLVEPYELEGQLAYHFDLYRLGEPTELEYVGYRDYLDGSSICLVEWPEKGEGVLPVPDLNLHIEGQGGGRSLTCLASTPRGEEILRQFRGA